jgi:hypothetical protein
MEFGAHMGLNDPRIAAAQAKLVEEAGFMHAWFGDVPIAGGGIRMFRRQPPRWRPITSGQALTLGLRRRAIQSNLGELNRHSRHSSLAGS